MTTSHKRIITFTAVSAVIVSGIFLLLSQLIGGQVPEHRPTTPQISINQAAQDQIIQADTYALTEAPQPKKEILEEQGSSPQTTLEIDDGDFYRSPTSVTTLNTDQNQAISRTDEREALASQFNARQSIQNYNTPENRGNASEALRKDEGFLTAAINNVEQGPELMASDDITSTNGVLDSESLEEQFNQNETIKNYNTSEARENAAQSLASDTEFFVSGMKQLDRNEATSQQD